MAVAFTMASLVRLLSLDQELKTSLLYSRSLCVRVLFSCAMRFLLLLLRIWA
jgi:hypothetical protein